MSDVPESEEGEAAAALADHPLTAARLAKVEALRAQGVDPYPVNFEPDATAAQLHEGFSGLEPGSATGSRATVAGRIVGMRDMGKLLFAVLQDHTGRIQLFARGEGLGVRLDDFRDLDLGDWVGAGGEVVTTNKGELSIAIDDFTLLSKALRPLPEKWHGLQDTETRYRQRYVDLIVNEPSRVTALTRSRTTKALRDAFHGRGFIEVETPVLQSQAGGALARPFVAHFNALDLDVYLRIATELHLKRLIVAGIERVFEIGRIFRNEGVSPRHNPEFTMLEAYMAYADYAAVMTLVEDVIAEVVSAVAGSTAISYQGRTLDLTPPYRRVSLHAAVLAETGADFSFTEGVEEARRKAASLDIEVEPSWGVGKIVAEVFERHVEPTLWEPTFVIDHPKEVSPLARTHRDDPNLTERFEFIAGGIELANAFSELNDPVEQRQRFEAQAAARAAGDEEAHLIDEDFLRALEYGMPPTGGLGLGVDRFVMLLTDQESIREVILFPTLRPEG